MTEQAYKWVTTVASNYINGEERHRELYGDFTLRQNLALLVWEKSQRMGARGEDMRTMLREAMVTDKEIKWLERTGRIPPEYCNHRNQPEPRWPAYGTDDRRCA